MKNYLDLKVLHAFFEQALGNTWGENSRMEELSVLVLYKYTAPLASLWSHIARIWQV